MTSNTVTRAYLTESLYRKLGYSRAECAGLVDAVLEEASDILIANDILKVTGFGTFRVRQKKARPGRNPKTKEMVPIAPRKVVTFTVSHLLKGRVNNTHQDT